MADQLRKDYLGCYGNPYVETPNIDHMARGGMRFNQCFVNNPICMPNRMSIFTGMYPHNHGMWTNGLLLPHTLPTLADTLKAEGYRTCNIGKMHFSPTDCGEKAPLVAGMEDHRYWKKKGDNIDWFGPYWGFDHVELTVGHATRPIAHYGKWFHENGGIDDMAKAKPTREFDCCPVTSMPAKLHDSAFIGDRSAAYIREQAGENVPFFLVASFPDPHHPFNPPREVAEKYKNAPVKQPVNEQDSLETRPTHYKQHQTGVWHRAGILQETEDMNDVQRAQVQKNLSIIRELMDEEILAGLGLLTGGSAGEKQRNNIIDERERDQRIRNTYAMVDLIDRGIGQILQALNDTCQMENTVILFTADHGELMGDHGVWLKGPFFYDGLISVPLIISSAGTSGGETDALASSVDIFPTCCDLLGVDIPRQCEGVSQTEALRGGKPRSNCLIEYRNGYFESDVNTIGYIDSQYKFIQYQNGSCELTDRINDPEENINLAAGPNGLELVSRYREKLLMGILESGSRFPSQISHA